MRGDKDDDSGEMLPSKTKMRLRMCGCTFVATKQQPATIDCIPYWILHANALHEYHMLKSNLLLYTTYFTGCYTPMPSTVTAY